MSCTRGCCADQRSHYQSIRVGADRTKPLSNGYSLDFERQESRDIDAYKRLRADGLQPADYTGAADLESRATSEFQVEMGVKPVSVE